MYNATMKLKTEKNSKKVITNREYRLPITIKPPITNNVTTAFIKFV